MDIELDLPFLPLICCKGSLGMAVQRQLNGNVESFSSSELICSQDSLTDTSSGLLSIEIWLSILLSCTLLGSTIFTQRVNLFHLASLLPIYFYIAMGYLCYAELQMPEAIKL